MSDQFQVMLKSLSEYIETKSSDSSVGLFHLQYNYKILHIR